ncbi:MAG: aspartate aminotransferase family protein [Candidatus Kapabacteria bacterium]|nr:aspartate aminotransferase family protein [Candidatus Kapabacteria bacterium]
MNHTETIEREQQSLFQTYKRLPVVIDRAEGCRIIDVDGNVYLDFLGGIAVNALGHSHPRVVEAVTYQARRYMHVSNFFYQEPQVKLAEQLKGISGYDRVFFSNSGAEAIEAAMKLARRHGSRNGVYDIVGFTGGFHGRTYAPLSIMDKPLYKEGMGPFLPNTMVLPYNDIDAFESRVDEHTCAVVLEFLQGEGGIAEASSDFVDAIVAARERYGFLLIADEVQAGIGRTGDFFAYEQYGIRPDIVVVAKSMGGGMPLGAVLATDAVASLFDRGMHGTTYGGNAVACAAGSVVVQEVMDGLLEHVRSIGAYLHSALELLARTYPQRVAGVRGRGCMQGLVLHEEAAPVVAALLERRVIANATAGNVVRIVPPYIITRDDVDAFVAAMEDVLRG